MADKEFIIKYQEVFETLADYGWIITPFLINKDFQKISDIVSRIRENKNPTQEDKDKYLVQLKNLITNIVFHPLFRAFFVYRSKEVSHVKKFSHHIERAILHYYKNDYFSTVLCLLPAIEGSLLSYFGWHFDIDRKPSINKLIEEIEKCKGPTFDTVTYKLYSSTLSTFLRKWIFSDTASTDLTYSYLNRHYVLHGMGTNNYYSLADANRLIMFFDLFIEFLSLEENRRYIFIPEDNEQINSRSQYYFKFIEKNIKKGEILRTENKFLLENANYTAEQNIPNRNDMVIRETIEFINLLKELDLKFNKKGRR